MKTKEKFTAILAAAMLFAAILLPCAAAALPQQAFAAEEQRYCDDENYSGGEDSSYNDNQIVNYDSRVIREENYHVSAPTYTGLILGETDICAPVAGLNVVVYYDPYFPNLLPNFEPGMEVNGYFRYYPDLNWTQTDEAVWELYNLMDTNQGAPGTANSDFKNGLVDYFENHGYNMSYSGFYSSQTNVNLSVLDTALNQDKVALILCSQYNFVYSFIVRDTYTEIVKRNSNVGHIMMVYGYMIVDYYKDGSVFQSDTYLYVSSGYGTGIQGFIKMNDHLKINEALIVNVS